jgi:DtxR family Mn-dependent transcriptional regulator
MLRYLAERGIVPGVVVTVVDRQPFGGPLTVRLGEDDHHLGRQLASAMRVT